MAMATEKALVRPRVKVPATVLYKYLSFIQIKRGSDMRGSTAYPGQSIVLRVRFSSASTLGQDNYMAV